MIALRAPRVVSFSSEYMDVYWEVEPTTDDLQEYDFFLERSEAEGGPYDLVAGPLVDRFYVRDNSVPHFSANRDLFYRVRAVHRLSGREVQAGPARRGGQLTLDAAEMVRLEQVLFREFVGVRCWLFPRKTFGQRCPQCFDKVLGKRNDASCPLCWGTTFSGGYHYPVEVWAQVDQSEETEQVSQQAHLQTKYFAMRCGPSPDVKPLDLVVDHQNRRFRVISVSGTYRLGVRVRHEVRMAQIQPGMLEDAIPLRVDTAQVTLVPGRNFTNPQNLEAARGGDLADYLPEARRY